MKRHSGLITDIKRPFNFNGVGIPTEKLKRMNLHVST